MNLDVSYDAEHNLFYLSEGGIEVDVTEIYPGINLGLDADDTLIGVEVWAHAKQLLGPAIEPLLSGGSVSNLPLNGSLAELDAQLRPAGAAGYLDYMEAWPELMEKDPEAVKTLETLRRGVGTLLEQVKSRTAAT